MNLHDLLYSNLQNPQVGRGSLLISDPMMEEIYFRRSVVMILDAEPGKGHLGLTLNKGTRLTLHDLMPGWGKGREIPVFCGGPVDFERLFLLHSLGDVIDGASEIIPGIYVGGDVEQILTYIDEGGPVEDRLRFFLGYSGWSEGQLETEISRHSWAVRNPDNGAGLLKGEENEYWRRQTELLGESYRSWLIVPSDPSDN